MSVKAYFISLSLGAALLFVGLRSLPDTHCAFLHADHQPVYSNGVEFCGVNEQANFYQPSTLKFPVKLDMVLSSKGGLIRLIKDDGRPYLDYEIAVSHTQKVHLHVRQITGRSDYVHIHPVPAEDGTWSFDFPKEFLTGNPGGELQAYVDFVPVRSGRVMLAEVSTTLPAQTASVQTHPRRNQIISSSLSTHKAGESALIKVQLDSLTGAGIKLKPIMGALGHAVLFADSKTQTGYAHMHPSLEGGEYDLRPALTFKLRLPIAGRYDLWLNINDGTDDYLYVPIEVTP
jgi:hypothetical protein